MDLKVLNLNSKQVDYLNIGLIIISLLIAFNLPFVLFLIAYAILGPLHYLTEINWLRERKYFVSDSRWLWIVGILAVIIVTPQFLQLPITSELIGRDNTKMISEKMKGWDNSAILACLMMAIGLVATKKWYVPPILAVVGAAVGYSLRDVSNYNIFIGFLIPTIVHVYVFTLLFMFFGTQKSKSIPGYIAILLTLAVPVIIIFIDVNPNALTVSNNTVATYYDNNFYMMNYLLAKVINVPYASSFDFYDKTIIKLQIFISFAYTYHYLNWFSKTSIIGWHKMSRSRSVLILALWLGMVALYAYDYKVGFFAALFLSFLHVLFEFPLNFVTMKAVGSSLWRGVVRR